MAGATHWKRSMSVGHLKYARRSKRQIFEVLGAGDTPQMLNRPYAADFRHGIPYAGGSIGPPSTWTEYFARYCTVERERNENPPPPYSGNAIEDCWDKRLWSDWNISNNKFRLSCPPPKGSLCLPHPGAVFLITELCACSEIEPPQKGGLDHANMLRSVGERVGEEPEGHGTASRAMEILSERFAKGEIDSSPEVAQPINAWARPLRFAASSLGRCLHLPAEALRGLGQCRGSLLRFGDPPTEG